MFIACLQCARHCFSVGMSICSFNINDSPKTCITSIGNYNYYPFINKKTKEKKIRTLA